MAVLGPREAADGSVALRLRDGRHLPATSPADAISLIRAVSAARSHELLPS